ncbi:MAG: nitrous oxide reductase accessory protein NosL [Campylobacterota bacterium]|nr:nitrous oxide reductase accessory protein NosL [Campylobacterota bacterium]
MRLLSLIQKRDMFFISLFFILNINAFAIALSQKVTVQNPHLIQKEKLKNWCSYSGENLLNTYKTNYFINLSDGTHKQYASLRFLASDYDAIKARIKNIKVVDFNSEKIIDAKGAYYLVNSKIETKYTKYSKLAFEKKDDALKFKKKYKGDIREFDFVLYMATKDIPNDIKYNAKKQNRAYKKGEKIYKIICQEIKLDKYNSLNDLKSNILNKNLCKNISEKKLQMVSKYLWDKKRLNLSAVKHDTIKVSKDEKCPVCGMFVYKYPRWAAQIYYKVDDKTKHFSFDGVKDMMKFYFSPNDWGDYKHAVKSNISKISVTDYYGQKEIDGSKAFYVIGSDVFGPMGHEFIPFEFIEDAKVFKKDHFGEKIIKFDEIKEEDVYKLDN